MTNRNDKIPARPKPVAPVPPVKPDIDEIRGRFTLGRPVPYALAAEMLKPPIALPDKVEEDPENQATVSGGYLEIGRKRVKAGPVFAVNFTED